MAGDPPFVRNVGDRVLFDALVDTVSALVVVLDENGRILRFNRACEELTGYAETEVRGRPIWDILVPGDEVRAARTAFQALFRDEQPSDTRGTWLGKSGARHPIQWSYRVTRDAAGTGRVVIGSGTDLTAPQLAEEAAASLQASEARYSGIVSIAADAIISVDEAQRIVLFNEGAEEIFGWSAAEIIGRHLDMLIPERFRHAHAQTHIPGFARSPVASRRMGERREIYGVRRNGEEFPAEASISKVEVRGERIFTVVLRDVTERKWLEESQRFLIDAGIVLSSSLDFGTTLNEVARLAVRRSADFCIIDIVARDGRVERLSATHRDPAKAALAQRYRDIPLDRSRPHLSSRVLHTGEPHLLAEVTAEHLDTFAQNPEHRELLHELRPVSMMGVPLQLRDRLLGAIVFISTSRRYNPEELEIAGELARRAAIAIDNARLYEDSQRAIRARDEVVGIVAHDLGNPISAIRIGTTLLLKALPNEGGDATAHQHLAAIRASTEQMERLIGNLLDLRRIESGRLALAYRRCSPAHALDALRQSFALLAADRGITLDTTLDPDTPAEFDADPDRVQQVLENLVANAIKFTRSGGRVTVTAARHGADIVFEVRDTGRGIAADHLPHLFDRFWQAAASDRRSVGLGLSIVKGIVDAHDGRVWVESEVDSGSTFRFTIPATTPDAAPGAVRLAT